MKAMDMALKPMKIALGSLTIMLESCRSLLFTNWAMKKTGVFASEDVPESAWDVVPDKFSQNEEAMKLLKAIGKIPA
ncbi:hypothetical protein LTR10_021351 [Elasticomyces elasticus]|uniref:Uncharacterized protein n=1 Tax=Exophiala sideris TaxID=1016849 RepID=A0ABR0JEZ8_9EURO|nr:hypothetical protein LTR10_021351 [Elasticomyces elasticus]KAK5027523.1 hypothetical protein LTR13_009455 [Exophiala sideris]KAK5032914.1 hypothetical protein LTS07_004325 [Exophiala sideris]KAK5062438.1 hypothetical protein LTR69_004797 [Exophiala sideris]KAK5177596.1 hypothetical protein LTR44_010007 [Eurotiomycetes sp. CCFEE 6388]